MKRSINHKLALFGMSLLMLTVLTAVSLAQSDETSGSAAAVAEQPAPPKQTVAVPALTDLRGVTIGMTEDEVREKLGKPATSDASTMYYIFDNGESMQLGLGADDKVTLISAIYSGSSAKAPDADDVFGAETSVQPQADGRIYKRVRYPSAGLWVAYSRLNVSDGPMTTVTIQKIDLPKN